MKKVYEKIVSNKILVFLSILFLVSILTGILYFFLLPSASKSEISTHLANLKLSLNSMPIINNQLILCILIVLLSFSIIGFPIILFIYFYEGICLSFTITSFAYFYGFRGIIFYLLYFIIFNLIYYIAIFYLVYTTYNISKQLLKALKKEIIINLGDFFRKQFTKFVFIMGFLLIFNILIHFFGTTILKLFIFLL